MKRLIATILIISILFSLTGSAFAVTYQSNFTILPSYRIWAYEKLLSYFTTYNTEGAGFFGLYDNDPDLQSVTTKTDLFREYYLLGEAKDIFDQITGTIDITFYGMWTISEEHPNYSFENASEEDKEKFYLMLILESLQEAVATDRNFEKEYKAKSKKERKYMIVTLGGEFEKDTWLVVSGEKAQAEATANWEKFAVKAADLAYKAVKAYAKAEGAVASAVSDEGIMPEKLLDAVINAVKNSLDSIITDIKDNTIKEADNVVKAELTNDVMDALLNISAESIVYLEDAYNDNLLTEYQAIFPSSDYEDYIKPIVQKIVGYYHTASFNEKAQNSAEKLANENMSDIVDAFNLKAEKTLSAGAITQLAIVAAIKSAVKDSLKAILKEIGKEKEDDNKKDTNKNKDPIPGKVDIDDIKAGLTKITKENEKKKMSVKELNEAFELESIINTDSLWESLSDVIVNTVVGYFDQLADEIREQELADNLPAIDRHSDLWDRISTAFTDYMDQLYENFFSLQWISELMTTLYGMNTIQKLDDVMRTYQGDFKKLVGLSVYYILSQVLNKELELEGDVIEEVGNIYAGDDGKKAGDEKAKKDKDIGKEIVDTLVTAIRDVSVKLIKYAGIPSLAENAIAEAKRLDGILENEVLSEKDSQEVAEKLEKVLTENKESIENLTLVAEFIDIVDDIFDTGVSLADAWESQMNVNNGEDSVHWLASKVRAAYETSYYYNSELYMWYRKHKPLNSILDPQKVSMEDITVAISFMQQELAWDAIGANAYYNIDLKQDDYKNTYFMHFINHEWDMRITNLSSQYQYNNIHGEYGLIPLSEAKSIRNDIINTKNDYRTGWRQEWASPEQYSGQGVK